MPGEPVFAAGWWAAEVASEPPNVPLGTAPTILHTVQEGSLERVVSYPTSALWPSAPAGVNGAAGTLTSIDVQDGQSVDAGTVLYTVDLRPAVAAADNVPSPPSGTSRKAPPGPTSSSSRTS